VISLGQGAVAPGGSGSKNVDLSSRSGGLYIFGTANVSHCSAPGGVLRDFSSGRVIVNPVGVINAQKLSDGDPPVIDGDLGEWGTEGFTRFAVHPEANDLSEAKVKLLWDADCLYAAFDVSDTQVETTNRPIPDSSDAWDSDSVSIWLWAGTAIENRTDLTAFAIESRQGPICECGGQPVGSSKPIYSYGSAWRLKESTTCNNDGDVDQGFTCEMAIPWDRVHIVPVPGIVISADLFSVDHDANPCQPYDAPGTVSSKLSWDRNGESPFDDESRLGGAIRLIESGFR
jgi:hypothetical protein